MVYCLLVSVFSIAFMFANILGGVILPFPFSKTLFLTSGTLVYPITFVISDLVAELYGEKRARIMVSSGFAASLLAFCYQYVTQGNFRISAILIVSSLIGFVSSQLLDIRLFTLIKKWTKSRHLWLRNQVSTYFSQLIDTLLVNFLILFWGLNLDFSEAYPILLGNLIYKMLFTVAALPLLYLSVKLTKEKIL